jgi:hypothetical protein
VGDGAAFLEEARRRLANTEWNVSLGALPDGFSLEFEHPLSVHYTAGFRPSPLTPSEMFERVFRKREFDVVAACPSRVPHLSLVQSLRAATLSRRFTEDGLALVAQILQVHDALTDDEAEWLASSGRPWAEEEDDS